MKISEKLAAIGDLVTGNPDSWTRGAYYKDGYDMEVDSPKDCEKCCTIGFLCIMNNSTTLSHTNNTEIDYLYRVLPSKYHIEPNDKEFCIANWNDTKATTKDVAKLFYKASNLAAKENR